MPQEAANNSEAGEIEKRINPMATKIKLKRKTRSTKNQVAQVYLYEAIGLPRYKIGWAFSASDRCEKLKRAQPPVDYKILEVFDCYNAEGIEDSLHKKYKIYKVELEHSEEWFEFPPEVLAEVREIYKNYQREWREGKQFKYEPAASVANARRKLSEKLAKARGLEKKVANRKKSTLQSIWLTTNLILEVIGRTAKELVKKLLHIAVDTVIKIKKKGQFNTKRRGSHPRGLYYHRSHKISLYQIGAAAIAFCVAGAIIVIML